jgi:hypothetical protein
MRSYPSSKFNSKLSDQLKRLASENWERFANEVQRVQESNFYMTEGDSRGKENILD